LDKNVHKNSPKVSTIIYPFCPRIFFFYVYENSATQLKTFISRLGPTIKIESNETRVCADRNSYNGKLVKKVVGTFKNGTLNGPCHVFFTDEISMIGTFVNGDPKGLLRAFDAKGQLLDMFYEDVRKNGHIWMNKNDNLKYLIYTDGSFVKKNNKGGVISEGIFKLGPHPQKNIIQITNVSQVFNLKQKVEGL
jgi:hypothetical protein